MNYFLIAGEASGDLHASRLIEALKQTDRSAKFCGLGGAKMQDAGCLLLRTYDKMAYMGILDVIAHSREISDNWRITTRALRAEKPDCLILVDYPSFNLKVAEWTRKHLPNTKIVWYIPPKVWAWKRWRTRKIGRLSDAIYGIFPFEPAFYERYGFTCSYVGNPTAEQINNYLLTTPIPAEKDEFIAILPGSREREVRRCLPRMLEAAAKFNRPIVITAAPSLSDEYYRKLIEQIIGANPEIDSSRITLTRFTYDTILHARAAVVNSGTATLETALLGCPQVAVYHITVPRILKPLQPIVFPNPYFTLVNIIARKQVIKELLWYDFTVEHVAHELNRLLSNADYCLQMRAEYKQIASQLGTESASQNAAKAIMELMK